MIREELENNLDNLKQNLELDEDLEEAINQLEQAVKNREPVITDHLDDMPMFQDVRSAIKNLDNVEQWMTGTSSKKTVLVDFKEEPGLGDIDHRKLLENNIMITAGSGTRYWFARLKHAEEVQGTPEYPDEWGNATGTMEKVKEE